VRRGGSARRIKMTYWDAEAPQLIHEIQLLDVKVGVLCSPNARRIISTALYRYN
jgi:hypothetical protein